MLDLLITNATVIDGTGDPGYRGCVGVRGAHIEYVGPCSRSAREELDVTGLVVCPGFVDIHTHNDVRVFSREHVRLLQGITTEVVGNCGFGPFPAIPGSESILQEFCEPLLGSVKPSGPWYSARDYVAALRETDLASSVAALVGHGALRIASMGARAYGEKCCARDRVAMCALLDDCLREEGVVGLSMGLEYAPGSFADWEELVSLAKVVASNRSVLVIHLRNQGEGLERALAEALELAAGSEVRVHISHLQACVGDRPYSIQSVLTRIDQACDAGVDISFDMYPYRAGSSVLTYVLPQWLLEGGVQAMMKRIREDEFRTRAMEEIRTNPRVELQNVVITSLPSKRREYLGKDVVTLAHAQGLEPSDFLLRLLAEEHGGGTMVVFNKPDVQVRTVLQHRGALVASDAVWAGGLPHPRYANTFTRFLGRFVRDMGLCSLEEGVHKCTGLPAQRLGLNGVGLLREGYRADMVILNPVSLTDWATYERPFLPSTGISKVLVGGKLVQDRGRLCGRATGVVLSSEH